MGRKTAACFGGIFITKFEMDSFDIFVIFLLYGKENCHFLKGIFINHDIIIKCTVKATFGNLGSRENH